MPFNTNLDVGEKKEKKGQKKGEEDHSFIHRQASKQAQPSSFLYIYKVQNMNGVLIYYSIPFHTLNYCQVVSLVLLHTNTGGKSP